MGSLTPIDDIGKMVNIGTLLAFVIVCIAVMILRRHEPDQPRPFRTPWVPLVPILGIAVQRLHDVQTRLDQLGAPVIWLVIGMVVYFSYSRHHSRVQVALGDSKRTPSMAD